MGNCGLFVLVTWASLGPAPLMFAGVMRRGERQRVVVHERAGRCGGDWDGFEKSEFFDGRL